MGKGGGGRERRGRKIGKKGRRLMMLMGEIKGGEWRKWNGFRGVFFREEQVLFANTSRI